LLYKVLIKRYTPICINSGRIEAKKLCTGL